MSLDAERQLILDRIRGIDFLDARVVVAGSAAMPLHGIELGRTPGDIDVFVSTADWFELRSLQVLEKTGWESAFDIFIPDPNDPRRANDPPFLIDPWHDIPVHIFFAWRYRPENNWDIAKMMREATIVEGNVLVAPLDVVYQQKMQARRPKDLRDMALILEHNEECCDVFAFDATK